MKALNRNYDAVIEAVFIFIILLSSTTGWYLIDFIGMTKFWILFIVATIIVVYLILRNENLISYLNKFFKNKFNIISIIYLFWLSITYLINYTGISSILYIFKAWVLVGTYLLISQTFFIRLDRERRYRFLYRSAKYIFLLGTILSIVALYQFLVRSNNIFGLVVSDWPAYNPAAMYGNVNGFGTYLFFSIASGIYLLVSNIDSKIKYIISFITVAQIYMLYLTVARTSIVITIFFIVVAFSIFASCKTKQLKNLLNFKTILILIFANLIMLSVLNYSDIKYYIFNKPSKTSERKANERKASDMLAEKNSKGVNSRQFIWKSVLKNYEQYTLFGDGLKYNIVNRINVEEVISKRSKGVSRISYHNTLFRYFASNGFMGLTLFVVVFFYAPFKLSKGIRKQKQYAFEYLILLTFFACIFLYMQMEEVYLGEVGFVPIVLCLMMSFTNSLFD